ncbi:SecDF P1 head subdomain-containing protein [Microbacterium sp. NPDC087589]|uniref:SecDF P1 head subdomain-containing protein n=1 Tax=Microbacterium sp. NPDC087589 TaxID=3364191 RepID=UPI003822539F
MALALAFALPVVGFILGVVARAKSRAAGSPTALATAAAVIGAILSVVWTVVLLLLLSVGGWLFGGQTPPSSPGSPMPSESSQSESGAGDALVVRVTAERELDSETLDAARTALTFYGDTAGIEVSEVAETDAGDLTVTFGAAVTDADIDAFAQAISAPVAEGFYSVTAVNPASGGADLGDGSTTPPCDALRFGPQAVEGSVLACDDTKQTQLLLEPSARLVGNSIADVEVSGDVVAVALSAPGAEEFVEWTRQVSTETAPANQIALVDFIGVITAPTVAGELTGEFQISGPTLDAELLAARLRVLSAGVSFSTPTE